MHHPHDQWFKALMRVYWELVADVELERAVHVPPQRIDLAYEPRARAPDLGIIDRMAAQGPGMLEYFAGEPSDSDIKSCVRKRLNYDHERALAAGRAGGALPHEPRLWLMTATRPRAALDAIELVPMTDWPHGCWYVRSHARVHLVILDELPHEADTLPLRLLGRGRTLQHALAELRALPHDHVLHTRGRPVLFAFRPTIMQDLETADMDALQYAQEMYAEWERRTREDAAREAQEEARAMLLHLMAQRFGDVPVMAVQRAADADHATLMRWAMRVLTARSIDDMFE
jgi:hypothetical protein